MHKLEQNNAIPHAYLIMLFLRAGPPEYRPTYIEVGRGKLLDFEFEYLNRKPIRSCYENQNISPFWLTYKKWWGSHFFTSPKNRLFQCWSYFTIFSFIVWGFGAWNVSNDREFFCIKLSIFTIFWKPFFMKKRSNLEKMRCSCGHYFIVLYYQRNRSQPEFWICCRPVHDASFGIFLFEKFHQEVIKFFFTKM